MHGRIKIILTRTVAPLALAIASSMCVQGCATHRLPSDTVPWQVAINRCAADYKHVWSTAQFRSNRAEAKVTIVMPQSAMAARSAESASTVRSAESAFGLSEQVATAREDAQTAASSARSDAGRSLEQDDHARQEETLAAGRQDESAAATRLGSAADEGSQAERDATALQREAQKESSAASAEDFSRIESEDTSGSTTTSEANAKQVDDSIFSHSRSQENSAALHTEADEAHMNVAALNSRSKTEDFSAHLSEASAAAVTEVREMWPELTVRKLAVEPIVLAGWRFSYAVSLINTGPLRLHSVRVEDEHPGYATFLGIDYRWYERLLPFLRKVEQTGPGEFTLRRGMNPGQEQRFRLTYRAHLPRMDRDTPVKDVGE